MKTLYYLALTIVLPSASIAQEFARAIATSTTTQGKKIVVTPSGYMIVGECASVDYKRKEILLYNVNKVGDLQWSKTYGGDESYAVNDIYLNVNGSIGLLAERYLKKRESLLLMNLDSLGNLSNAVPYDENGSEVEPYSVAQNITKDNIIVGFTKLSTPVVGGFYTANKEDQYLYLLKTNANGDKLWSKYIDFGASTSSAATSIVKVSATEYIIVGYHTKNKTGETVIIKINDAGKILWSKNVLGNQLSLKNVELLANNTIAIIGSYKKTKDNTDISIVNMDINGNLLWSKTYGGSYNDNIRGITSNKLGIVLTGVTKTGFIKGNQICLLNIGFNGILNWANTYTSGMMEDVSKPLLDNDYVLFTGLTFGEKGGVKSLLCKFKNEDKKDHALNFITTTVAVKLMNSALSLIPLNQPSFGSTYTLKDTKTNVIVLTNSVIKL